MMGKREPVILMTAFEPSGDALAAPLVARLKAERPGLVVYALGGPKMEAAGAELIETTTEHGKMLLGAVTEAGAHWKRLGRLKRWLKDHPVDMLIPIDSPAANWSICGLIRKQPNDPTIVHLVCPQVWAWATWRVKKLKRLTDHVLCLLPYEEAFLKDRGIPGTFVGHPLFEDEPAVGGLDLPWGDGEEVEGERVIRLALLPGSRAKEIERNWPTMLAAYRVLAERYPSLRGVVAARTEGDVAKIEAAGVKGLGEEAGEVPETVVMRPGVTESVIAWSEVVLVVSGTATLQVAARRKPMVAMFNMNKQVARFVAQWIVKARTFTLPNLIGESMGLGRVIVELVPHFGEVEPVVDALEPLLVEGEARGKQLASFEKIGERFGAVGFTEVSAREILGRLGRVTSGE